MVLFGCILSSQTHYKSQERKRMKIVKIENYSLQKKKQINQKQLISKKSLYAKRKKQGDDLFHKKIEVQPYDPKLIYQQSRQHSVGDREDIEQLIFKGKKDSISNNHEGGIQETVKSTTKSSLKFPTINMTNKIGVIAKNDGLVISGIQINKKDKYLTSSKLTDKISKKEDGNSENGVSSSYKFINIKSIKHSDKDVIKNDLSLRQLQLKKIDKQERTKNIQRKRGRNQTENSIISKDCVSQDLKNKTQTKLSLFNKDESAKKQRKSSIIVKNQYTSNLKKKYSISYLDFCLFISLNNKMNRPSTPVATYKAFVGKGNNSILVKNTLKNRFWWNVGEFDQEVNLHWTQQRDNKFIKTLKSTQSNISENTSIKKFEFLIQVPKENQKIDPLKNFCGLGIAKLMSYEQRKNVNPFHVDMQLQDLSDFENPNKIKIHNHLQFNWNLTNKKALYYNMKNFYLAMKLNPFEFIPLTFHVQKEGDNEWQNFIKFYMDREEAIAAKNNDKGKKKKQKNLWIIKPGQNSNQGCGIDVADNLEQIRQIVKNKGFRENGKGRSHIIQKYLMPFLYNKRKFDIRCYILITSVNCIMKAYWYEQGYIRTSCKDFTVKNLKNRFIHLTNDAVQKKSQQYGKYQNGNKISFSDFQKYLDNTHPGKNYQFFETVYPKMMRLASDAVKSSYLLLDAKKRQYSFEIMGLDFMIDEDFNTWLIQVNNNPCLELGSPLLARIIPNMIQNAFKIALDPIFPPPKDHPKSKTLQNELFQSNKFTLIFNSNEQDEILKKLLKDVNLSGIVQSDEEEEGFQDQIEND